MKRLLLAVAVLVGAATVAGAQPRAVDLLTPPLPTREARHVAAVMSWGSVLADVALDTRASWQAPDRGRALALQGVRLGVTFGSAQAIKYLVGRTRPCANEPEGCGADAVDASFYSLHTAFAAQTIGGPRLAVALPLMIGSAGLRVAAGKHYLTDVVAGACAGWLAGRIR